MIHCMLPSTMAATLREKLNTKTSSMQPIASQSPQATHTEPSTSAPPSTSGHSSFVFWCLHCTTLHVKESRVGAVVRALASHQCGPGSNPGPGVICGLSLLLVLALLWGFFSGFSDFPPFTKINISKFQFDRKFEGHKFVSLETVMCYPR